MVQGDDGMIAKKYKWLFLALALPVMLMAGCILSGDDDGDGNDGPGPSDLPDPKVLSVSISDGEVFDVSDISVEWAGNKDALEYRYTVDEIESAWIDTTFALLYGLGEGMHTLTVEARNDTIFSAPVTVSFEIDSIDGPGVIFSPRAISDISYISLYLEDVEDLMAAHIEIVAWDNCALFMSFVSEVSLDVGTAVLFSDTSESGRMKIDIAFGDLPEGISGRLYLGKFILRPLAATGEVSIDTEATEFRDTGNLKIMLNETDRVRIEQ